MIVSHLSRLARFALPCAVVVLATGCQSLQWSDNLLGRITPYRLEIVQGNVITKEQAALVKPGMTKAQVRDVLGSPLLTDLFHVDRWDYVFTIRRKGVDSQERHLAVFFNGEVLDHVEGDTMPSESDFVATLDNKRKGAKIPELEAPEEKLKRFAPAQPAASAVAAASAPSAAEPPPLPNYPPLEPPAR
jgi:outer membrane protein assembly factor BamE